jgi:dimeric dUTPase (all-alpha-NTP-PPase superfamily)
MVLNFTDIIQKQKELDEVIFKKAQRTYNNTFDERKLALVTEIAEFANELRSFKY